MLEIVNRQRKIDVDTTEMLVFAERAAELIPAAKHKSFAVGLVSDRSMRRLNRSFLGKNQTTDVLSFPHENDENEALGAGLGGQSAVYLGDIVISAEQAQRQAAENGLDLDNELKQLILHGILHLCGYDHETDDGEMNHIELELRDKLSI